MELKSGIKNESLKKGNYDKQINQIIKKYFDGCKIYNGKYGEQKTDERFIFFRGQSKFRWRLKPSINRGKYNESQILEQIIIEHPEVEKDKIIAYGQHYGFPTRAIDFTSDLKTALYFACAENYYDDGALYICSYIPHQNDWISSLTVNLISQMKTKIIKDIDLANELMHNEKYLVKYDERSNDNSIKFVCADFSSFLNTGFMVVYDYKNEEVNERIKLQKGSLFYCGSKYCIGNKVCSSILCSSLEFPKYKIHLHKVENPTWINSLCVKVRIPKILKNDILKMTGKNPENLGLNK